MTWLSFSMSDKLILCACSLHCATSNVALYSLSICLMRKWIFYAYSFNSHFLWRSRSILFYNFVYISCCSILCVISFWSYSWCCLTWSSFSLYYLVLMSWRGMLDCKNYVYKFCSFGTFSISLVLSYNILSVLLEYTYIGTFLYVLLITFYAN